jgi:hypothetical protein
LRNQENGSPSPVIPLSPNGDNQKQESLQEIQQDKQQETPPPIVPPQPKNGGGGGRPYPSPNNRPKGGRTEPIPEQQPQALTDESLHPIRQVFLQEQFGSWTPRVEKQIAQLVAEFGISGVLAFFDTAIANNKRFLAYVKGTAEKRRSGIDPAVKHKGGNSSRSIEDRYAGWEESERRAEWPEVES